MEMRMLVKKLQKGRVLEGFFASATYLNRIFYRM
jgi:hypothetical protein